MRFLKIKESKEIIKMEENKVLSLEKREEILKLILKVKDELNDNSSFEKIENYKSEVLVEMQKEIQMISNFCVKLRSDLDELKEQFKDLRDSFLMKAMMEKVAYVPLEKLPIYKDKT